MDQQAIQRYGIVEEVLMENAGLAAYRVLSETSGIAGRRFLVVCGAGNNGGDGLVVTRKIHSGGGIARVILLSDPAKYKGAAKTNFNIVSRLGLSVRTLGEEGLAEGDLQDCDAIVDAIFGTGLDRPVAGRYRDVIQRINQSGKPVLSLDIPSGVAGDTGRILGIAVQADNTVTFGLPKIGNLLYPGFAQGGRLHVTHISFPPELYSSDTLTVALNEPPDLPPRDPAGYKGSFGNVLFIAGDAAYFGAPYFSAFAFLKAGGGYARLAAPHAIIPVIAQMGSEIVFHPQAETAGGSIALENETALKKLARTVDMLVMGPGLSLNAETRKLVQSLTGAISVPLLLDGDGITAAAEDLDGVRRRNFPTILTPHLGEMARLTGLAIDEITADPVDVLRRTAEDLGATVVLKGPHSLIGFPDGRIRVNMSGNAGMATAGSGDVLTGAIAAMVGLGMPVEDAAAKGVFLHGVAGDLAAEHQGRDGMTARDILAFLPLALKTDREQAASPTAPYGGRYRIPVVDA